MDCAERDLRRAVKLSRRIVKLESEQGLGSKLLALKVAARAAVMVVMPLATVAVIETTTVVNRPRAFDSVRLVWA